MRFFSGFCLCNEKELFREYLEEGDFVVAGFSYGAQKAVEFVLNTPYRVDKLQLLSPAYFSYHKKIIEMNIKAFCKDKKSYIKNFLKKAGFWDERFLCDCELKDLKRLFYFDWNKIKELRDVKVEVFLGERDRIIDVKRAYEFFKEVGEVYYIKNANHFLRRDIGI